MIEGLHFLQLALLPFIRGMSPGPWVTLFDQAGDLSLIIYILLPDGRDG